MGWMFVHGTAEDEKVDLDTARRVLRRTASMLGPYRRGVLVAGGLLVVWTATILAGPLLVRTAIDNGLRDGDSGALNISVVLYVVVAAVAYLSYRAAIVALARVGESFLRDLRTRTFDRMLSQSMSFYDRSQAGVLVSRMTSDVDALQELVQLGLLMFIGASLLLLGTATVLTVLSWKLMALCALSLPVVILASIKFQRDSNVAYLAVRDRIGDTLTTLQEGISGVRVVQAFAREDIEATRFAETNRDLYRTHMASVRIQCWYLPLIEFAGAATTALALGVGGWLAREGQVSLGTVVAFVLLLANLFEPVQQLSQLFNMVQSGTASLHKIYELVDTPVDVRQPTDPVELAPAAHGVDGSPAGRITVDEVSFSYGDGTRALAAVSLTVHPGEKVALVGPTGAGKSTLAKLIARFYDPTEGAVHLDGVDLRDISLHDLRDRIVVVPQEGFLFTGTVADNIRVSRPDATDAQVATAVEQLGMTERLAQLPEGLSTQVHERGSRLSAGEKQLVSLARAALVDPAVLVLDEATSSVDPGTEATVERAMESLMESRTVIAIAHRLSTAQRCDRVAVIEDGRLVELGGHDELVTAGGRYAALYDAWTAGLATG